MDPLATTSTANQHILIDISTTDHFKVKSSVCKTLVNRAYSICDERSIKQELTHLNSVLSENGFPKDKIHLQPPAAHTTRNIDAEGYTNAVCIPYIGSTSHKIEHIIRRANIKVYHSSQIKTHQLLFSHKDKTNNISKPGLYHIPCECGKVYIGETGQNLTTRQKRTSGLLQKRSGREIFSSKTCVGERPQNAME